MGWPLDWIEGFERSKRPTRVPVVLSHEETRRVLAQIQGTSGLIASLLYGTGLRLMEVLRLRIKDVDFARGQIVVHEEKGRRDRGRVFPEVAAAGYQPGTENRCLGWGSCEFPPGQARGGRATRAPAGGKFQNPRPSSTP